MTIRQSPQPAANLLNSLVASKIVDKNRRPIFWRKERKNDTLLQKVGLFSLYMLLITLGNPTTTALAQERETRAGSSPIVDQTIECQMLIVGGGLAGTAAAYEALQAGRTVCLTEITDWVGGQLSSQGTSALDEAKRQRQLNYFAKGYQEFRARIKDKYGTQNPGDCWVSLSCFLPKDAHTLLWDMLQDAARKGRGKLQWLPSTVIKELEYSADGKQIVGAIAIQHTPAPGTPPLNTETLSQRIEDAYRYEDSTRLSKTVIHLVPKGAREPAVRQQAADGGRRTENRPPLSNPPSEIPDPSSGTPGRPTPPAPNALSSRPAPLPPFPQWIVIEATETGEIVALADVPYRLGLDARSHLNPSSPSVEGDPYCTQGFTYTFAMEQTQAPQPQQKPAFYDRYAPYYGYDPNPAVANFEAVFTYRRIWSPQPRSEAKVPRFGVSMPKPGDISMQNWVWGNDYRPGTAQDNLIYSRDQLQQRGELVPGNWAGGLRTETLKAGEEIALGFYYWLTEGTTNSQPQGTKQLHPNHRLLTGLESPMGTAHGLSKYPYIRESRRIVGRPSYGYSDGFMLSEIDISKADFRAPYYRATLPPAMYRNLWVALAGLQTVDVILENTPPEQINRRARATIYPDAVGIAQYAIDFHPCMTLSPPETPGNTEREGVRTGHGQAYPGQIPLRAMIPQKIDNLIVAGKNIATSYLSSAAYRVHSFEWSSGAAAAATADLALAEKIWPYQLVDDLPRDEPLLRKLQAKLNQSGNPTAFPNTSIFNVNWEDWRTW